MGGRVEEFGDQKQDITRGYTELNDERGVR